MFRSVLALLLLVSAHRPAYAQSEQLDQMLAGLLMRNGLLCSRVVEKRPSETVDHIEVTCIEYWGGTKRVRYLIDLSTRKASKAE
jgi:hypothetical protein